jgi:hypothetical protein
MAMSGVHLRFQLSHCCDCMVDQKLQSSPNSLTALFYYHLKKVSKREACHLQGLKRRASQAPKRAQGGGLRLLGAGVL